MKFVPSVLYAISLLTRDKHGDGDQVMVGVSVAAEQAGLGNVNIRRFLVFKMRRYIGLDGIDFITICIVPNRKVR